NGMAVRRGLGDHIGADCTTGPRSILDHEGLPDLLTNLLEHHSGDDVAGDAGRDRYHHSDAAGRPILRRWLAKGGERHSCPKDKLLSNFHYDSLESANGD